MIGICWFCHLLIDKNATSRPLRQSSEKHSDSAENAREVAIEKKMLVRSVVRVRNMAFSLNMNWRLNPSARSVWCWFWKSWEPGFKSSRCNKCLYYMFLWLNCSIRKLFFVSIIRRRTSWLLSYHMEERPYWQRVKFTGVSAVSVFNI